MLSCVKKARELLLLSFFRPSYLIKLIDLAREGDTSRGLQFRVSLRFRAIWQFQNECICAKMKLTVFRQGGLKVLGTFCVAELISSHNCAERFITPLLYSRCSMEFCVFDTHTSDVWCQWCYFTLKLGNWDWCRKGWLDAYLYRTKEETTPVLNA